MTMPTAPGRGGFNRKVRVGHFIRNVLSGGPAIPHDIYIQYKSAVNSTPGEDFLRIARRRIKNAEIKNRRSVPKQRVKISAEELNRLMKEYLPSYINGGSQGKVKWKAHRIKKNPCCSYNSFMHYIYVLRELGLIENTGNTDEARGKAGGPTGDWHTVHLSETIQLKGDIGHSAWDNLWEAYQQAHLPSVGLHTQEEA